MTPRLLTNADKPLAKALWRETFSDSDAFVDWFFANRYRPEWSVGLFEGEKLITAIHGTPMELSLGGGSCRALMTSGVATVPAERGRGHMHEAMRFLQAHAKAQGIEALFNHPQTPGSYARLGFRNSTFTKYWQGGGSPAAGEIGPFSEAAAYGIYQRMSARYAGFAMRSPEAFHQKLQDYFTDGAEGFMMYAQGSPVGYCVYYDGDSVYGEEVLSLSSYGPLLHELRVRAGGRQASAKLPPDAEAEGEVRPQNVMLAPEWVWTAMEKGGLPCFCVDEY